MAALSQQAAQNAIKGYRKNGLDDQQIIEAMLRRKDNVGSALRQAKLMADESGEIDSTKTVAGLIGLKPQGRVKGNSQTGKGNPNATWIDKGKSYGNSIAAGLANSTVGAIQLNDMVADGFNKGVNKLFGTNLKTDALAKTNATNDKINARSDKYRLAANRTGGDWVKGATEIGVSLPFYAYGAGGSTMAARAGEQAVRGAAVSQLGRSDSSTDRLYKMGFGAAGAAAGQVGGELVAKGASKVIAKGTNAVKGRLNEGAKVIDDLGKQYKVRTSVGDIKGGGTSKNIEVNVLEKTPVVGMKKFRESQLIEAESAATKVVKQLKNIADDVDFEALKGIEIAAKNGDKNARRILGIVNAAEGDSGKLLQASLEVKGWRQGMKASKLYNRVEQEVIKSGNDFVPPVKTRAAIVKELDKQAASFSPNKVVVKELGDMLKNIDDAAKPRTFKNMRNLRSTQGNLAQEYGVGAGKGDAYASTVFGKLRTATESDISNFANNSGNTAIKTAYKKADKFYSGMMRGNEKAFTKAAGSTTPDQIYSTFVKRGKGDAASNFYNALDAKGQATLRYQMADEALSKATNPSTGNFSPAKFANEFDQLKDPYGRIFKGEAKAQMDGFAKLMRHVERAGQFKENPPTGVRMFDVAVVGGAIASPQTAATAGGFALFAKTLLTSKAGKNLLLAANKLPAGQQAALDNILKSAVKISAATGEKVGEKKGDEVAKRVAGTKVDEQDSKSLSSF